MGSLMKIAPTGISLRVLSCRPSFIPAHLLQRGIPSSRVLHPLTTPPWQASQSSRRQLTSTIHRLSPSRSNLGIRVSSKQTPLRQPSLRSAFSSYGPTQQPQIVVGVVVGICVAIFAWHSYQANEYQTTHSASARGGLEWYDQNLVLSLRNLREGRYHTLLTSTLTHYNLMHLSFNMFALWGFGQTIVMIYGVPTFAAPVVFLEQEFNPFCK